MLLQGFATFEHITDFITHTYRESCVLLHEGTTYELSLLRVICCQKCTQTNSEAIQFVDICKAKTLLCNYDVHAHIENSLTVLHMCSNWKVGKQEKKLLISVSYKCTALFQIS